MHALLYYKRVVNRANKQEFVTVEWELTIAKPDKRADVRLEALSFALLK